MRILLSAAAFMICAEAAIAANVRLMCHEKEVLWVTPETLAAAKFRGSIRHRIDGDRVFLNDPSRVQGEYLYNKLTRIELGRYVSGHKTYIFNDDKMTSGTMVHSYKDEVRIAQLVCE